MTHPTVRSPVAIPVIADARATANDYTAEVAPHAIHNPLWIVVIGLACFFSP